MARESGSSPSYQRWVRASGLALALGAGPFGCGEGSSSRSEPTAGAGAGGVASDCESDAECDDGGRCVGGECVSVGCRVEERACTPNGRGVVACDAEGGEQTLTPCATGQRCTLVDGQAACRMARCEAAERICVEGEVAQLCGEDGFAIAEERDCAALGQVCVEGQCVSRVCDAECEPASCKPGEKGCSGERITQCAADGIGYEPTGDDCSDDGQACFAGACAARVCEGTYRCEGKASVGCFDNGTRVAREACGEPIGTFCSPATGRCEPYVCLPAVAICQGVLATRCADDGSGPLDVGIDCGMNGETCWDGGCAPIVCSAGFRCVGSELSRCGKAGSEWMPVVTCEAGTECDAPLGACRPKNCVPNTPVCLGAVATTCEASGSGYTPGGADCLAQGKTCIDGKCERPLCVAGQVFCIEDKLVQCDAIGASSSIIDVCSESESCDAAKEGCVTAVCSPGSSICNGNLVTTCNAQGSGPVPGGEDCAATGDVCVLGECLAKVCEPKLKFCVSGNVWLCNDSGTSSAPFALCAEGQPCSGTPGSAACGTSAGKDLL